MADAKMRFLEHIVELRKRLLVTAATIAVTATASFFFAENGEASFKELAEMISRSLGFGGKTLSLSVEDVVRQYGEDTRYGVGSNSRVKAVNARRLGWVPKGPSLVEVVEGHL